MLDKEFPLPKSYCTCNHSGDGPNSNHADTRLVKGHGKCLVPGCNCEKFTWVDFYPHFKVLLPSLGRT